ncbi:probable disease resistance protein At4g27220 [Camellia sinensis]|uniref:probable disease resistance protein At4g27220 n=1 Tax=Camellia sinensis TaxID=4442 RepID=UPI0010355A40|nr:probable disease resistance protein At4g27220 [Camellia sinensis]
MSALQGIFSIVGGIAGRIVEPVIQLVVPHVGFVFQYKKKQKKLEVEIKNLEEQRKQIEEKVDEAITRGEELDEPVSNWLMEVEERVQKIKDDNTINENMQCFKFSCPDYIARYRISKEAENKMEEVKNLTQSGNFSTVAHPKPFAQELQFTSSSTYANFESRELIFNNIMVALQDSDVKMIGVYGTGGVGKTAMVEEIGKQVKNGLFNEVVVAVVSQDANVSNIEGQLTDRLSLKLNGETEVGKANELWNRLNNGKKNLIILDDIWQELNLKTIGIPITNGNNCCKVVITSRIRGVLEKMHVDRYVPMQVLLEKEAWALFKTKVGNSVDFPELHDIADAVCKECGGLPVAILALGAALKDKKKYVWEDVLDQFKDSMLKNIAGIDPKVYASLKLSYDRLESSDANSCFLLCCFFPEDANISIEVLARHCIARSLLGQNTNTLKRASRRVLTVVDILKDACLLLEGKVENFVKMHDVIRDVALSIAKDDGKEILVKDGVKEWPEKDTCESYSAISLRFDNTLELPDDLLCPQLHTLTILLKWTINALLNVPDRLFSGMEKLTILELDRICMLPPLSLANLVNLRMLLLSCCELGDIAILKDLNNNLEILSLRGSNIKVLPLEIGQLTRLRLLDLKNCYQLTEIPQGVISNLSHLEELYILDDLRLREPIRSKVNLDELGKLTQLTTIQIHIPNVMLLPKDFCFENLIRFKISMGIGTNYGSYGASSKWCELVGVSLMDKFIVLLRRAEELHLEKIEGLQEVLHDRGEEGSLMERHGLNPSGFFDNLIKLTIKDCRLEYLFSLSCARGFPRLQTTFGLSVRDCRLKYLFSLSCARGFPRLQRLRILDCEMMEAIVGIEEEKDEDELSSQVINFSQLKYLRLENLPKLISFYPKVEKMSTYEGNSSTQAQFLFNEKVTFPALERLDIDGLKMITEIWDRKLLPSESFRQLRDLTIRSCEKLVYVGLSNMPRQLPKLKELEVRYCRELKVIVLKNGGEEEEKAENNNNTNSFLQLTSLILHGLRSLKSFFTSRSETQSLFTSQVTFPALERLDIDGLTMITEIWDRKLLPSESFRQLRDLTIRSCEKLVYVGLSNMPRQLPKLKNLEVRYCRELKVIVLKNGGEEEEKAKNNNNTNSFLQLTSLMLHGLQSLKSFFTSRSETQSLFTSQVTFPALERLDIDGLTMITEIWDRKLLPSESFRQLRDLTIRSCEKLVYVGLSNMPRQLPKLKELEVSYCRELKVIVLKNGGEEEEKAENNNNTNSFLQLTSLILDGLWSLKSFFTFRSETQSLFTSQVAFPVLEYLKIQKLPTIIEIWDKQLLIASEKESKSFCQLKDMTVSDCEKLVHVVQFNMLPQLQNLNIFGVDNCPKVESIVSEKEKEEEEGIANNDIIGLSQLTKLTLRNLISLKSFYNWSTRFEAQPLFNYQVSFPRLETLILNNCVNSREIHPWNVQASKICLNFLDVANLNKLIVRNCSEVAEVFQLEGLNVGEGQHVRPLIEVKMMELDGLPQLTCLWNKDPHGILGLQILQYLTIKKCSLLRNLFTCSTAMALQQLKVLYLESCPVMEEVIAATEDGLKEVIDDVIEFPKLEWLILKDLPNLNSFCNAKYNFNLPSLQSREAEILRKEPNYFGSKPDPGSS